MVEKTESRISDEFELSDEKLMGNTNRWRRFGEPVPAGRSNKEDGSPDYGLFGPGSIVWKVLLHPATITFQSVAQWGLQLMYKPVTAGVRDQDPLARKLRQGKLTAFDYFERLQRNSGIHAPMWFGDTTTAEGIWNHLYRIHSHVEGGVVDVGEPELGGFSATGPRDVMLAALTEMVGMLWVYENFAWHGDQPPHRLSDEERDQYIDESAAYLRMVGAPEDEIPHTMAEADAMFDKYQEFFKKSETADIMPDTGQHFDQLMHDQIENNWHPTQQKAVDLLNEFFHDLMPEVIASYPEKIQLWGAGWNEEQRAEGARKLADSQQRIRQMQESPETRHRALKGFWGPDGIELIKAARELDGKVRAAL